MKKVLTMLLLTIGIIGAQAQTSERKWNLGLFGGTTQYAGDIANGFLDFNTEQLDNNLLGGLSISRYLNKSFDVSLMGSYGTVGYYKTNRTFKLEMMHANAMFKYKFANGYILEENSVVQPYIAAGAGFERFKGLRGIQLDAYDYSATAAVGVNFALSDVVGLNYQATYIYMLNTDSRDGVSGGDFADAFLYHTVGINFNLGKSPDADGDGVSDKKDQCPNTPAIAKVDAKGCPLDSDADGVPDYQDACVNEAGTAKGCPDADKDGVADKDDQCPNEAGLANLNGCPDTDGDGIIDSKDKCPNVKGTLELNGCPDKDGDGITDSEDKCPDVKGIALFSGCPDTDGDSIPDMTDACPDKKGPISTNGCPDTDGDGVHDGIDKCPTVAGPKSNEGCPELKQEIKQLFQKALQGIQFETGKAVIKKQSNGILDAVVKMMKENPNYKLIIEGHTDDVGDDQANMTLSQNRAEAVAKYLISNGVDPLKVSATGYGETKPVDTNKTKAGKARNRRVELKVEFLQ